MSSRFDYVKYDDQANQIQDSFKKQVTQIETDLDALGAKSIDGATDKTKIYIGALNRSRAVALTKLEELYMWIGKAVRDEQILRNGSAELMEGRKDG